MTTIERLIIAAAVPCKKWIDCANRHNEKVCVVNRVLSAPGFVENDFVETDDGKFLVGELGADFFARAFLFRDEFSRAIGMSANVLIGEIGSRGDCRFYSSERIECPNCRANVEPSSISFCPNCREIRCRSCRDDVVCGNCSRVLCSGCIVVETRGRGNTYKYDACFSCKSKV